MMPTVDHGRHERRQGASCCGPWHRRPGFSPLDQRQQGRNKNMRKGGILIEGGPSFPCSQIDLQRPEISHETARSRLRWSRGRSQNSISQTSRVGYPGPECVEACMSREPVIWRLQNRLDNSLNCNSLPPPPKLVSRLRESRFRLTCN